MNELAWYVVQSNVRKESFVRDRIEELGREAFLPLLSERRRGRRRATTGPFFPGYLFARLSECDGDLARVRWLHGVRRVLGDGDRPRPVHDGIVDTIRIRADATGRVRFGGRLRRGDRVKILDGPFAGLIGVLERPPHGPEQRILVLLELFQRVTRVQLGVDEVHGQGIGA